MDITSTRYFSLSVEDRAGELARFTEILKQENVDLEGLWGLSLGEGKAQIIAVPKDADHCASALSKLGAPVVEGTCFRLRDKDRMGALVGILDTVAKKGINLHAVDAIAVGGELGCYLWSEERDVETVRELLGV